MQQLKKIKTNQSGSVYVGAITLTLSFVIIAGVLVQSLRNHSKSSDSQDEYQEVAMLQQTVLDNLDCQKTLQINPMQPPLKCSKQKFILRDKYNKPLFRVQGTKQIVEFSGPASVNIISWELESTCTSDYLQIKKRQPNRSLGSFLSGFSNLWADDFEPKLCRSYFPSPAACTGTNSIHAGYRDTAPLCCHMIEASGFGSAKAGCPDDEFLLMGGAYCAPIDNTTKAKIEASAPDAQRCLLDADALLYKSIGTGSGFGITLTNPSLPAVHTDVAFPAIMYGNASFSQTKTMRSAGKQGGFLLQSGYSVQGTSATIDSYVASCKFADWEGPYATTSRAICCPKKP